MSSKEKKGLVHWLNVHSKSSADKEVLGKIWDATGSYKKNVQPDVEAGLAKFRQRKAALQLSGDAKIIPLRKRAAVWRMAAALALLLAAVFVIKNFSGKIQVETVTAEPGVQKNVTLTDGTTVALNENSQLFYSQKFADKQRKVRLEGEGFFEVAKNPAKPFLIETAIADVEVLGTSFNVRSYQTENFIEVFVKTGKVAVISKFDGRRYELKPGEKLKLEKNAPEATASQDDSENSIAWKTRMLRFKNSPFREVFAAIERLHGVEIEVENEALLDCPYTSNIQAEELQKTLEALKIACELKISEPAPKHFSISGNCCN